MTVHEMEGYPTYSDKEVLSWINRLHTKPLFITIQQMKDSFDTLATIDGLLLWRVREDTGLFTRNDKISVSPTHTSGAELLELDGWTTVTDDWFHQHIGDGSSVDPNIRDTIKDLTLA